MAEGSLGRVYFNRRMAALLGLGFASGLPSIYRLLGSTLQAWLGDLNYDVKTLGLVALIGLPMALNFLWAPLLDRYTPPILGRRLGRRRSWLLVSQVLLMAAIAGLACAGPTRPGDPLRALAILGLVVAFVAATQDVVADAYRTDVLPDEELGAGAAVFVNGYRIAMLAAGGGALLLAQWLPWRAVYLILASGMLVGVAATLLSPRPEPEGIRPASLRAAVVEPFLDFLGRNGPPGAIGVLGFVVLFKVPDAMAAQMTMPLLLTGLGFEKAQVGLIREWFGLLVLLLGAFAGGAVVAKMPLIRSLWLFGALQALSNLGFCVLAWTGKSLVLLAMVVAVENFCAGMVTVGFIAFLMSQCNRRYSAFQYALFTSLSALAGSVIGSGTGFLVEAMGYVPFFALSVAAAAPGMLLLLCIRPGRRRGA